MTTAEAAQAWAEAKDKLGAADAAMASAQEAYKAAYATEKEAWSELQKLSGRAAETQWATQGNGQGLNAQQSAHYQFDDGFKR